jgi:hypothetical protein
VGPAIIARSGKRLPKATSNVHQWVDTSPHESWYAKSKILYVSETELVSIFVCYLLVTRRAREHWDSPPHIVTIVWIQKLQNSLNPLSLSLSPLIFRGGGI